MRSSMKIIRLQDAERERKILSMLPWSPESRALAKSLRIERISSCFPHITLDGPVKPTRSRKGKSWFSLRA